MHMVLYLVQKKRPTIFFLEILLFEYLFHVSCNIRIKFLSVVTELMFDLEVFVNLYNGLSFLCSVTFK